MTDPDSLHYERANGLARFRKIHNELRTDDVEEWLEWLADALEAEIHYSADKKWSKI